MLASTPIEDSQPELTTDDEPGRVPFRRVRHARTMHSPVHASCPMSAWLPCIRFYLEASVSTRYFYVSL